MHIGISMGLTRLGRAGAALPSVLQILSTYGANAYMWIPGVGTVSGFDAKNWLNSNYTTALAVDQQVGSVSSSSPSGTIGLAQATAGSRPFLRQSGAVFSWEFDGTDDRLTMSAAPLSFPSDHTLMVAATPTTSASTKTLFSVRNGGQRLELTHTTGNQFSCQWAGANTVSITPPTTYLDVPAVVTCAYSAGISSMRVNGGYIGDIPHTPGTFTFTQNHVGATNGGSFGSHYKGKLHGVILIKSALTGEEQKTLETFLATLAGTTITPENSVTYYNTADLIGAYMGYYTNTSGVYRMERDNGSLFLRINNAKKAYLYCGSGDTTPYRVLVDSLDFAASTTPPGLDSNGATTGSPPSVVKIKLFDGASQSRSVLIYTENSITGNQFGNSVSGKLLAIVGDGVSVAPVGTRYYCADPVFHGVCTNPRIPNATYLPSYDLLTAGTQWNSRHVGSIHFRAKFTELYVFSAQSQVEVSVDGGAFERMSLTPPYTMVATSHNWRKLPITGSGALQSIIIAGSGEATTGGANGAILGVMLTGDGHEMQPPLGSRRHVVQFGASQTEGVSSAGLVDTHLAQDRLPIYTLTAGWAGKSVRSAVEDSAPNNFDTWAATITYKDILLISLGINDITDMPTFQANYQILIGKALTAGFQKVICRGLGFPVSTFAEKNARIAAAVAAVADARVVYASVDTWTDSGLTGVHPDRAGYITMANNSVRDHAALYA